MSDSDVYSSSTTSESEKETGESSSDEIGEAGGIFEPYQNEPPGHDSSDSDDEDEDGLTPEILESRCEREITVETWCSCGECRTELLVSAREYRCCQELLQASGKLVFDGIDEKCITNHPDFSALTNETVLRQVCPLLKSKNGRNYQYPSQGTRNAKNECLRAVAYRWLIRWMFAYLGWDNTKPLPACIYNIRKKFPTSHSRGYASAQERR